MVTTEMTSVVTTTMTPVVTTEMTSVVTTGVTFAEDVNKERVGLRKKKEKRKKNWQMLGN